MGILSISVLQENLVRIIPAAIIWNCEQFTELMECNFSACSGKVVEISGKAPLWIYMYCALRSRIAGAAEISVYQAFSAVGVHIFPLPEAGEHIDPAMVGISSANAQETMVEYNGSGNFHLSPEQLPELLKLIPVPDEKQMLILSGSMPNYLAAAAAVAAWEKGWLTVAYWSPRNTTVYQLFPALQETQQEFLLSKPGKIIGIVGDPNSGKSVFSDLLEYAGRQAGVKIWKYDCDFAAPTPKWYLEMRRTGQEASGDLLRKQYKQDWDHQHEEQIAKTLETLKVHHPLIIADFPGGKHKKGMPPETAERIPPGREIMLTPIDGFIIIARKEIQSDLFWREELAKQGMEKRIILTVFSQNPDAPLSLSFSDKNIMTINGLDRNKILSEPQVCKDVWNAVSNLL